MGYSGWPTAVLLCTDTVCCLCVSARSNRCVRVPCRKAPRTGGTRPCFSYNCLDRDLTRPGHSACVCTTRACLPSVLQSCVSEPEVVCIASNLPIVAYMSVKQVNRPLCSRFVPKYGAEYQTAPFVFCTSALLSTDSRNRLPVTVERSACPYHSGTRHQSVVLCPVIGSNLHPLHEHRACSALL